MSHAIQAIYTSHLGINHPIFTVASEFIFSNGGHILDPFRSSFSSLIVEALICTQDLLKNGPFKIQELEKLEEFVKSYDEHGKCL